MVLTASQVTSTNSASARLKNVTIRTSRSARPVSNRTLAGSECVRCRNERCRTKLAVPTSNHHKAFCAAYCYDQFYKRRCLVCEKQLPEGHRRQLCSSRDCRRDYRNFRHSYVLEVHNPQNCRGDSKSPCGTEVKSAHKAPEAARIIAGPALSDFSLWAATLPDPKPQRSVDRSWRMHRQPGELAAEWTARELARRDAEDEQYVKRDEERLRRTPLDASGNYPLRPREILAELKAP